MPAAPAQIEEERAKRFLKRLRNHSFIAVVVEDSGNVEVFHRGIETEHIGHIREALDKIKEKDADPNP